jgi:hypothetical protein
MRTNKQIEASRRNGAQSRGPVTSEGKASSASNATRHGLSSKVVVLSNESQDEFTRVLESYTAHWNPVGQPEIDLVHDIVAARWRLNRILALETATLDIEMDRQRDELERLYSKIDEPIRCAMAFSALADSGRTLAILSNHETRLRRTLDRATAELRRLQTERRDREQRISTNEPTGVELPSMQQPKGPTPKPALKLVPQPELHHPGLSEHTAVLAERPPATQLERGGSGIEPRGICDVKDLPAKLD